MSTVCPVCGAPIAASASACAQCGAALPPAPIEPSPTAAAVPQPPAPPPAFLPAEPPPPPALEMGPGAPPASALGMQPPMPSPAWPAPMPPVAGSAPPAFGPPPALGLPPAAAPVASTAAPRRSRGIFAGATVAIVVVIALVVVALSQGHGGATAAASPTPGAASASAAAIASAAPSAGPTAAPSAASAPSTTPTGPVVVKIGISLPMSSDWISVTGRVHNAILMAIKEAAPIPNVTIEPYLLDYAVSGSIDERQAIKDMQTFAADQDVVAVVGPYASGIAYDQIPVGYDAKLLECAPDVGWPGLTKGVAADELRGTPEATTTFLRVKAPDDDQGTAMADYAASTLKVRSVVIVDGGGNIENKQTADRFAERWGQLSGTPIVKRIGLNVGLVTGLQSAARAKPGAVFFAGDEAGAAKVRSAMATAGLGKLPLLANAGVAFGGAAKDYFALAGKRAANTYVAYSYAYDIPDYDGFASRFSAAYGVQPSTWSPQAYACTQVVIEAIRQAAAAGNLTREGVRRAATNPAMTFTTAIGPVSFNRAGDMVPAAVTIYQTSLGAKNRWVFAKQLYVPVP